MTEECSATNGTVRSTPFQGSGSVSEKVRKDKSETTPFRNDKLTALNEGPATVAACIIPAQNQASQHSSVDVGGDQESLILAEELRTLDGF